MNLQTDPRHGVNHLVYKRNRLLLIVALFGVMLLAGYGYYWLTQGRFIQTTDDAYVGGDITSISAKVDGYVVRVNILDNQSVKAGDLLVQLDDRDYRASLAQAEGEVSAEQAALVNVAANRSLQEATIEQAKATITGCEAQVERTQDDVARYQKLHETNMVSAQSLQQAQTDFRQAVADDKQARATLLAAQRELTVIDSQRAQALAALDKARAGRDLAKLNLEHTRIYSPINGVVGNRRVRMGAWTDVGSQLLDIIPDKGLWVDANFKEDQLADMHPGLRATIRADIQPDRLFHGSVDSLSPATGAQFSVLPPENATGNFTKVVQRVPVRITLDDRDGSLGMLRPGLSVVVSIETHHVAQP